MEVRDVSPPKIAARDFEVMLEEGFPEHATLVVLPKLVRAPHVGNLAGLEIRHPGAVNVGCNNDVTFSI